MRPVGCADTQKLPSENPSICVKSQGKLGGLNPESLNPVSILVVDDSVECRMILRIAIEREGYRCVEAADGIAALKLFQQTTIDFIITDFQMPHMNGCEFLEVLLSAAISCPPAVMITGNLADSVRMRATHAGALAVFSKPFDLKKILEIVREVVHRNQEALH
ncbi:response regulator [uncultured Nitrospira sp.]|uniref:response regulator n=1 Tax=uncultured Nitrospira sp. TaxID=157176 RepID=UPI00313FF0BC